MGGLTTVFASGMDVEPDGAYTLAERQLSERLKKFTSYDLVSVEHSTTSVLTTGSIINSKTLESTPARGSAIVVTLLATVRLPAAAR